MAKILQFLSTVLFVVAKRSVSICFYQPALCSVRFYQPVAVLCIIDNVFQLQTLCLRTKKHHHILM